MDGLATTARGDSTAAEQQTSGEVYQKFNHEGLTLIRLAAGRIRIEEKRREGEIEWQPTTVYFRALSMGVGGFNLAWNLVWDLII